MEKVLRTVKRTRSPDPFSIYNARRHVAASVFRVNANYFEREERRGVARKANTARYLIDLGDRRQPRTFPQDVQNATIEWNSENT